MVKVGVPQMAEPHHCSFFLDVLQEPFLVVSGLLAFTQYERINACRG